MKKSILGTFVAAAATALQNNSLGSPKHHGKTAQRHEHFGAYTNYKQPSSGNKLAKKAYKKTIGVRHP